MGKPFVDIKGQRYGRLVAVERDRSAAGAAVWKCVCDCGGVSFVRSNHLRRGLVNSCGCLKREMSRAMCTTHGGSAMKEYRVWAAAKDRCFRTKTKGYENYGGRGITMVPEWRDSFERFIRDMGACPPRHTLERIDNDGPYSPENCRWASAGDQMRNRRNNHWITYGGDRRVLDDWASIVGIHQAVLSYRLRAGWSTHRAFTSPVKKRPSRA